VLRRNHLSEILISEHRYKWQYRTVKTTFLCIDCRRKFIRDYANLRCVKAVQDLVVPLTINGAGIRDIERVLLLSTSKI
jgi:transposase-like protein